MTATGDGGISLSSTGIGENLVETNNNIVKLAANSIDSKAKYDWLKTG
jgi:hypothetical protein